LLAARESLRPVSALGGRFPVGGGLTRRCVARGQRWSVIGCCGRRDGTGELLRGQGIGEAGKSVGTGSEAGFGQDVGQREPQGATLWL
jgi:hypothetical protein